MGGLRAITVVVDYLDLLRVTLPWNRHHFSEVMVVTSPEDAPHVHPFCMAHGARVFVTDAFRRGGADMNKWLALEEGLDAFGRKGWLALLDADVLWPKDADVRTGLGRDSLYLGTPKFEVKFGRLCSPLRRMAPWPLPGGVVPPEGTWGQYPLHRNVNEHAGYSQVFHAEDPALRACADCGCPREDHVDYHGDASYCHGDCKGCGRHSWHETDYLHAGTADSLFQARWPREKKVRPPWECLHLGEAGANWAGRATPYLDGSRHPEADARRARVRAFVRGRVPGPGRFAHEKLPPAGG